MSKSNWREETTISLPYGCEILGIGKTMGYELARKGDFPGAIRIGNRFVISTAALRKVLGEVD